MKKLLCLLAWLPLALFGASNSGRDLVAEAKIEAELAQLNPALVEPFRQARVALDGGDFATSARLLEPVVRAAPNFDAALRRYGSALAATGRRREGIAAIERAVAQKRTLANVYTLATVLGFSNDKTPPARSDQERAFALLQECRQLDPNDVGTVLALTQLSFQLDRKDDARATSAILDVRAPELMATHYFAAVVAAIDEHWIRAEDEIRRAEKLGLDAQTVTRFLDSGVHSRALAWRLIRGTGWTVGGWALGLALLCALGFALSKLTLRQVERSNPNVAIAAGERRLRRIYRAVLNVAGIYYYVSLPVVLVLVVGAAGAIIYGFLVIGTIPIKLTLLLIIGAIATVWSMGRSLFLRVASSDPGRVLTREEAEPLWRLTAEVAQRLNTRPIDEIRLTPGTDLCVYERGTWREKLENKAQRVLVLGTAVLGDFKQDHFRSVLAHEYGHFAHRDTAGGDVALRVQNDMLKFYLAMLKAGQATWLNVAFHFLRFYHFIFRRISHGATRLQEVLADRVAAQAYGPQAFEGGLRHVIRRSIDFGARADGEIKAAIETRRPLQNLYDVATAGPAFDEKAFTQAIERPTSEDDTHPAPHDRFRLIAPIPEPAYARSEATVWELFKEPAAVMREMMETIEKNIATHRN